MIEILKAKDLGEALLQSFTGVYQATQIARWDAFIRACKIELKAKGTLSGNSESRLLELFSTDFSKKHSYDFVRRAIENNSEIARLALARLFIRCSLRSVPNSSFDEMLLMSAYTDLDDRDVHLLLFVRDLISNRSPDIRKTVHLEITDSLSNAFEMTREEFEESKEKFLELQCQDAFDLRDSMEIFAGRRVFKSTTGLLGSTTGTAFSLVKNHRSDPFMDDLIWARDCLGETR